MLLLLVGLVSCRAASPALSLDGPWPAPGAASTPLRAFSCVKQFTAGKSAHGTLTARFTPVDAKNVTFRFDFRCTENCREPCTVGVELALRDGVLATSPPGVSSGHVCTSSRWSAFAVDCGQHLSSEVRLVVGGTSRQRTVDFRVPEVFTLGASGRDAGETTMACVPFLGYRRLTDELELKVIEHEALSFDLEACRLGEGPASDGPP